MTAYARPAAGSDAPDAAHITGMTQATMRSGFPPGTLMPSNSAIESGDRIPTRHSGDIIQIACQAAIVTAAADQKVMVRSRKHRKGVHPIVLEPRGTKRAADMMDGDYVCVPRLGKLRSDQTIDLSKWIKTGQDTLGRSTFGNRAVKEIPLDSDVAWLIGLYVAEGSASPHVTFSLSSEEDDLMLRIERIAGKLGYTASRTYAPNQKACAVTLGTTVLGRWLKSVCGGRAQEKHVPDLILSHASSVIRRSFLDGLIDGDGSRGGRPGGAPRWSLQQSSKPLMHDVVLLLAQDGIGCHGSETRQRPRYIRGRLLPATPLYCLWWNPDGARPSERVLNGKTVQSSSHRWKADESGIWYPVKSVEAIPFDGLLYLGPESAPMNGLAMGSFES